MKQRHGPVLLSSGTDQIGFTIVELMVSLTLLAIVTALALPSYTDMIEKRRLSHDTESLLSFIQLAQSEAIKRNEDITVSYLRTSDREWCLGAISGSAACDCMETNAGSADYCQVQALPWRMHSQSVGNTSVLKSALGDGAFTFEPVRGLLRNQGDSLALDLRSESEDFRMQLTVRNTGLTMACAPDAAHRIPAYQLCP